MRSIVIAVLSLAVLALSAHRIGSHQAELNEKIAELESQHKVEDIRKYVVTYSDGHTKEIISLIDPRSEDVNWVAFKLEDESWNRDADRRVVGIKTYRLLEDSFHNQFPDQSLYYGNWVLYEEQSYP